MVVNRIKRFLGMEPESNFPGDRMLETCRAIARKVDTTESAEARRDGYLRLLQIYRDRPDPDLREIIESLCSQHQDLRQLHEEVFR